MKYFALGFVGSVLILCLMDVLTRNAIWLMYDGSVLMAPCLQISSISNFVDGPEHGNHYRVDLSDGIHKQKASLQKKYNNDIDSK